jgi:hypothetical protein
MVSATCGRASCASAPIGFGLSSARWLSKGAKRQTLTTKLANRTLHARPRPVCPIFAGSPGRSMHPRHFCGSKAGATFRLAMVSIGSGLKRRASQRCRNNCLTLEMESGAPANFLGEPRPPHHAASGGGGVPRPHGPKLTYNCHLLYVAADDIDRSEGLTRETISGPFGSTGTCVRNSPRDVLRVVKLNRLSRARGTFSISCTNWKKRSKGRDSGTA